MTARKVISTLIVEIAASTGVAESWTKENIWTGRVEMFGPIRNIVTVTSSKEMIPAKSSEVRIPDLHIGMTMSLSARHSLAPITLAARTRSGSRLRKAIWIGR